VGRGCPGLPSQKPEQMKAMKRQPGDEDERAVVDDEQSDRWLRHTLS
jgi:hypothetical protein